VGAFVWVSSSYLRLQ